MERSIINFKKVVFKDIKELLNVPGISKEEKIKHCEDFEKNGWYNGLLMALKEIKQEGDILEVTYGKSNFFDFLIMNLTNQKVSPIICVNGVIESDSHFLLIKRDDNVFSCPNWWDFPAGMVPYENSIMERLFDRIFTDTKINSKDLELKDNIFFATLLGNGTLNFFYHLNYKKEKKELIEHINSKFTKNLPILVEKKSINEFIIKNNVVFWEILEKMNKD
jgi:hypothetical protein